SSLSPPVYVWAVSTTSTPAATAAFTNATFSGVFLRRLVPSPIRVTSVSPSLSIRSSWLMVLGPRRDGNNRPVRRLAVLVVSAAAVGLLPAADADSGTAPVIAFVSDQSGDYELWTVRLDGSGLRRLTHSKGQDETPAWSPDGRRIAFTSYRTRWPKIWVMNANGSRPRRLTRGYSKEGTPVWTRDGKHIVYGSIPDPPRPGPGFWSMRPNGTHKRPIRPGYGSPPSFS